MYTLPASLATSSLRIEPTTILPDPTATEYPNQSLKPPSEAVIIPTSFPSKSKMYADP